MAISSDQLQLLFDRQQERFIKSQLNFLDKLRTQLLNHPLFGHATEVDGLISQLRTELENDCSLHESSTSRNLNETAVIQDLPSGPVLSISETCPVMDSNSIIPKTAYANTDLSSSQKDNTLLNVHEIVAITAHEETENKSSSTLNVAAPNGAHHSAMEASDESNYRDSLVLPGMNYLNDAHVLDKICKNVENMSDASNDQKPNTILRDANYLNDPLSLNEAPNKLDDNVSEESNLNNLISSVSDPYHLISSSGLSTQCEKYVLNRVTLTVSWEYEDPTLFRGGG